MVEILQFMLKRVCEKISSNSVIILKDRNKVYTCGSSESNDIVCIDTSISKRHCAFSQNENTLFIEDLGSSNGVYINGILKEARKKHPLNEGDIISLCFAKFDIQDVKKFAFRVQKEVILYLDGGNIKTEPRSPDLENDNDSKTFSKLAKLTNDKTISEANKRMAEEKLGVAKNMQITDEANTNQTSIKMNIEFNISVNKGIMPNIYINHSPTDPNKIQISIDPNPLIKNEPLLETEPKETLGNSLAVPNITSFTFKRSSADDDQSAGLDIPIKQENLSEDDIVIISDDVPVKETYVNYISKNKLKQYQRGIPLEKELCQKVVSWDPKDFADWFSNPCDLDENELKENLNSYKSYEDYRDFFLSLVELDMSHAIKNAYIVVERNVSFGKCKVALGTIKRIFANQQFTNMLKFQIIIRNSMHASKFPKLGDLLRIDNIDIENISSPAMIFAYVTDYPSFRQMRDSTTNEYFNEGLYTVATKELEFNLNKSEILQLRVVTNLRYFMQLAEAMDYFKDSPLMPIITKPNPLNCLLDVNNCPTTLVTKEKLDEKQLNAVMKITEVALKREPKVILIEGPPGTGKTQVIVNTIFQLLQNEKCKKHENPIKILVCASTEAAVDEIVLRVNSIQQTLNSKDVKMIRLGEVDQMHENTRKFSIHHMSKQYLNSSIHNIKDIEDGSTYDQQKQTLLEKIEIAKKSIRETKNQGMALALPVLEKRLQIKTSGRMSHEFRVEEYNETLKKIQEVMILGQNLITCSSTTSFSQRMDVAFGKKNLLSLCIIDDASLVHEVDILQLLSFGVLTLVLLADNHKHSTKYVSSTTLQKLGMGESLFSRMKKNFTYPKDCSMITLDNEYRMNPEIAHFPNSFFYNEILINRMQPDQCISIFSYRIFNLLNLIDPAESETTFALNLILCVMKYAQFKNVNKPLSIAVVVPYNFSKVIMSKAIKTKLADIPKEERNNFVIHVDTIKGFRNQERDIVFASCIKQQEVQFLTGMQRLYSTLTIAKHCLILYGQFKKLQVKNQCMWNSLIEDAKQRKVFIDIDCSADFGKLKKYMIKTP